MSPNDPTEVKKIVRDFIAASISLEKLGDDENLFESGIVNSLFAMQLMTFLERRFGIEVGTDDLEIGNFQSISATAAFVAKKTGGPAA